MPSKLLPLIIIAIAIALTLTLCEKKNPSVVDDKIPAITSRIFESGLGGFGYDILINDTVFIHQPNVPVLNDNTGFPTEASARQVADLVIAKIRNHEMPPSVTREELIKFSLSE